MTLVLTSDQLTDLQGDLDIGSNQTVFTDDELNRLYNRAAGDYDLTKIKAGEQLLASLSKWTNYVQGQTQEDRTDRFKDFMNMLLYWRDQWRATNQARTVHLLPVPTRLKDRPYDRIGYRWNGRGGWGSGWNGGW